MSLLTRGKALWRAMFRRSQQEEKLRGELDAYLEMVVKEKVERGESSAEAWRQARIEFGGVEQVKVKVQEVRMGRIIEDIWQDIRYGARTLRNNPGFTFVAVFTLALGIGANTAIFSVVNGVLLRPLDHHDPGALVAVYEVDARPGAYDDHNRVTFATFKDWKEKNTVFESIGAYEIWRVTLTGVETPQQVVAGVVGDGFFQALQEKPFLGRTFLPEEDQPGNDNVAILSHGLWENLYGGNTDIIGQPVSVAGRPATVVGILRPGFRFLDRDVQIWFPMGRPAEAYENRKSHIAYTVARLLPGVTVEQARSEMNHLTDQLRLAYPEWLTGWKANVVSLHEDVVREVRPVLLVLLGAVGFLLLIASVNVANLFLARAATRRREMAIRSALGASRLRLVRQLLAETVLLAGLGGLAGLILAEWGIRGLLQFAPPGLARLNEVTLDGSVLVFALGLSLLTAVLFGLFPALQVSRTDVMEVSRAGGRTQTGGRGQLRMKAVLIVAEVSLSVVLLVGAGLLIRTLDSLLAEEPGFDPKNTFSLTLSLPSTKYREISQQVAFIEDTINKIQNLPGVESAGGTTSLPFVDEEATWSFRVEGDPPPREGERRDFGYHPVTHGYFRTMKIPLLRGRMFTEQDGAEAPFVMIINRAMADRYWPSGDALSKRLSIQGPEGPWREIVGIVGDVRHAGLGTDYEPAMYVPHEQKSYRWMSTMTIIVRTSAGPGGFIPTVQKTVQQMDGDLALGNVRILAGVVSGSVALQRFSMLLMGLFAALALVLSAVGLFGVTSYAVNQRTHEIGIRMALGASRSSVLKTVLQRGLAVVFAGVAIGLLATAGLARFLESLLYGVSPDDPLTYAGVTMLVVVVALLACYVPARRASKVDPMVALRYE